MLIFDSEAKYIYSCQGTEAKIAAIEAIIAALLETAILAATTDDISEYWLDDGQVKIKTIYKGVTHIQASIMKMEQLKQMFINQLPGGRMVRLMDSKNFPNNGPF